MDDAWEPYRPGDGPRDCAPGWERETVQAPRILRFKSAALFCSEYVPLAYAIEPIARTGSLYTLTAKTGAGKTAWLIVAALAIATGRRDILGIEVERGRVAFCSFENPDDVRMRIMIAAYVFRIDLADLTDWLVVLDERAKPEEIIVELARLSRPQPFKLIMVDTLAAFFDGDNINDNVQGGQFMRRMRPMTRLPGLPAVMVAAHPVKNAAEDQLVPYGSGAILNEVDGNLTLWRKPETGISTLHWQGKLRGIEFSPVPYRIDACGSPDVLDTKGRQVVLPYFAPTTIATDEAKEEAEIGVEKALLRAVLERPGATQSDYGALIGRTKSIVNRKLKNLERDKLVDCLLGKYAITDKGQKALDR